MNDSPHVIAFLGPSLTAQEARALLPGVDVRPPARQGDVLEAVRSTPRVIALIDGVFESQPSVWHQELRIALSEGIHVLGASSMGALRAVELAPLGMSGIGAIFEAYRTGRLVDDADVALLHADAEHDFRPLTLPLVNVRNVADWGWSLRSNVPPFTSRSPATAATPADLPSTKVPALTVVVPG